MSQHVFSSVCSAAHVRYVCNTSVFWCFTLYPLPSSFFPFSHSLSISLTLSFSFSFVHSPSPVRLTDVSVATYAFLTDVQRYFSGLIAGIVSDRQIATTVQLAVQLKKRMNNHGNTRQKREVILHLSLASLVSFAVASAFHQSHVSSMLGWNRSCSVSLGKKSN